MESFLDSSLTHRPLWTLATELLGSYLKPQRKLFKGLDYSETLAHCWVSLLHVLLVFGIRARKDFPVTPEPCHFQVQYDFFSLKILTWKEGQLPKV